MFFLALIVLCGLRYRKYFRLVPQAPGLRWPGERRARPSRPEVLEEMAKVSKGRVIQPNQLADLVKEITALPEPKPLENRIPLWSDWRVITGLVTLLAIFWTGRKLSGVF